MPLQAQGIVLKNKKIQSLYFLLEIDCPPIAPLIEPGQFAVIAVLVIPIFTALQVANLPPGLGNLDGISVEGLFTPDNWISTYRRPGFLKHPYVNQGGMLVPSGNPVWCVRFAPPILGAWQYRIEVREAKGAAQSAVRGFTAVPPSDVNNHGPVWRSATDRRYFEYADGTQFLWIGDTWWNWAKKGIQFSTFQRLADDRARKGFTVGQLFLPGTAGLLDKTGSNPNLDQLRRVEQMI